MSRTLPGDEFVVDIFILPEGALRVVGFQEVPEIIFEETEPGHWEAFFDNTLPGTADTTFVLMSLWLAGPGLFDGHIRTTDTLTGCEFDRDFTLKALSIEIGS